MEVAPPDSSPEDAPSGEKREEEDASSVEGHSTDASPETSEEASDSSDEQAADSEPQGLFDDADSIMHAAEAPTAMWDKESLLAAGIDIPDDDEEEEEHAPPATQPKRDDEVSASIEIELTPEEREAREKARLEAQIETPKPPPPSASGGLSWPAVIGLAAVLFVVVYFLVGALRS